MRWVSVYFFCLSACMLTGLSVPDRHKRQHMDLHRCSEATRNGTFPFRREYLHTTSSMRLCYCIKTLTYSIPSSHSCTFLHKAHSMDNRIQAWLANALDHAWITKQDIEDRFTAELWTTVNNLPSNF
jgi:hypothetical protein